MNNQNSGQNQIKHLLRNMRKKENKTIEQTAEELNVSRQTISNWESGKSTPDATSFLKFLESYDPSLENVRELLNNKSNSDKGDALANWGREYCDLYKKTGSTFLDKTGPTYFLIDDFLEFAHEKVSSYIKETDERFTNPNNDPEINLRILLLILSATPIHKRSEDIDFGLHMIELGLLLRRKGYIVNELQDDGLISIIVLDENQRKQLDSIILEHMLIPGNALKELPITERMALKDIQSEYDQMRQKMKDIKEKKLEPLYRENRFGWPCEYVLSIGHRMKDSNIETDRESVIYTTESLEDMANYISLLDERIKKLVDNKNTFFVLSDNANTECCFDPKGGPNEIYDIKLYRVNCHNEDGQDSGDGDE